MQLVGGFSSIGAKGGGVAFWAHIGGFVAGMGFIFLFKNEQLLRAHPYRGWDQTEHETAVWKKVPTRKGSWH